MSETAFTPPTASMPLVERNAKERADWLLDAVATATQDRRFLRGDPEYDAVAGEAILLNGEKAIIAATQATADAIETAEKALEQAKETLNAIASWRADSAAYTDSMNLPRRKMGEAQVIHIESEAKRPLKALDAALATIRDNR